MPRGTEGRVSGPFVRRARLREANLDWETGSHRVF